MDRMLTAREIYLRKRARIVPEGEAGDCPIQAVAAFNKNLEAIGFTLSRACFERLRNLRAEDVGRLYGEVVPILREMVGAHREFRPMYPNFPAQVMAAADLELYVNALAHYWGSFVADATGRPGPIILPSYPAEPREPLRQKTQLKVVDLGSPDDFERIFTRLAASNSSLSESDKAIVAWFAASYGDGLARLLPPKIPQKENLAFLVGATLEHSCPAELLGLLKTATDVLRVAVAMSGGDVSLATPTKFRKFTRRERRSLLQALESCGEVAEDMLRRKGYWIRLGEILHPSEYRARYPKSCAAFDILRNDLPFATFNAQVEAGLLARELGATIRLLERRPGDFARRLDHLLRLGGGRAALDSFLGVADRVSTPVLLQTFHHFRGRSRAQGTRAFFPKGDVGKMQVEEAPLSPLPADLADPLAAGIRAALVRRFRSLPPLGKVWVGEGLESFTIPFAQRSASKSLRTVGRGSRLALPGGDVIRAFLWWKNGTGRTDVDLSAVLFSADWVRLCDIAYFNLRDHDYGCYHSGDIVDAPNGACEFIDMDTRVLRAKGCRYAAISLNSFTRQPYRDLPECFAGWMARQAPQSGEVFEARTVMDKVDIASNSTACIPAIFDLESRQVIWADIALKSSGCINNVRANRDNLARISRAMAELSRPNLYDLFLMHAEARGVLASREEADTTFSAREGITPFATDRILAEFLA